MTKLSLDALQFSETAQRYGGKEAYWQAREAGETELPFDRWVQVRTPAFKEQFGDWEFAKESQTIRTVQNKGEAQTILRGLTSVKLINQDSGIMASLSKRTVEKILSSKAFEKSLETTNTGFIHLAAAANVDELFNKGVLGWIKSDRNKDRNIAGLPRIFCPMTYKDHIYMTKTTVKIFGEDQGGNKIYTVEAINVLDKKQITDQYIEDIKKGNTSPITMADADLRESKLKPCRSLGASRVISLANQIIDFNQKPIKTAINPKTGEPTIEFLQQNIPSPLIDISNLCSREVGRKLHNLTGGDIAHLPLITASIEADGTKKIDFQSLYNANQQHPIIQQQTWLKAFPELPKHLQQSRSHNPDKDNTR